MKEFLLPSSKSITNRLLIIRSLSQSSKEIINASQAEDSLLLQNILEKMDRGEDSFFCGNAGTTTRFLMALMTLKKGVWHLDVSQRMKQRPIKPLISALRTLGAEITTEDNTFPLTINGGLLQGGKTLCVDSSLSSQFISSLLLISPYLKGGLTFSIQNNIPSFSYVELTLALMHSCGTKIHREKNKIAIRESKYNFSVIKVENDWASALFACEQIAIQKSGELLLKDLNLDSIQPERKALDYFAFFGVQAVQEENNIFLLYNPQTDISNQENEQKTIEIDLTNCIDSFAPLAVSAVSANCKVIFKGIEPLRHKESNRIVAMQEGLQRLGANTLLSEDSFLVNGFSEIKENITIRSFCDHRIAMAFYVLSKKINGIKIDDMDCIAKSFPSFLSNF